MKKFVDVPMNSSHLVALSHTSGNAGLLLDGGYIVVAIFYLFVYIYIYWVFMINFTY